MKRKILENGMVIRSLIILIYLVFIYSYSIKLGAIFEVISAVFAVLLVFYSSFCAYKVKKSFSVIYFLISIFSVYIFVSLGGVGRYFVIKADGYSSCPNLCNGEHAVVSPRTDNVIRGDFVLFELEDGRHYAKRVHGIPGDSMAVCGDMVFVNGVNYQFSDKWNINKIDEIKCSSLIDYSTLNEDEYYVLGDNLISSIDSRSFGPIKRNNLKGVFLYKYSGKVTTHSVFLSQRFK
ncbi:MAG: signal peptidase I [Paraglaciecola sp.]|nr:signal peptidase I [Paraglaciecola sp.]